MSTGIRIMVIMAILSCCTQTSIAQTSWKGTTSTSWSTASNWTNGVPTSSVDAILGDANFTGVNQPTVNVSASCKSLTLGGTVATTFNLSKNLVISGNLTINSNGTLTHPNSTLTLSGNWTNSGTYSTTSNNAKVFFGGAGQSIGGSNVTTFRKITLNTGSTVTLARNVTISGAGSSLTVNGILNPAESPTYTTTCSALTVSNNGKIKINASTFAGNYISSGTTLNAGSIVEYSSTTVNQTVSSSLTYSTLVISGTGTKSLAANLPALNSSTSSMGKILVNSGTFDLLSFTANRGTTTTGGEINVANGAFLKIGGTNSFPSNFNTKTLSLNSTVEYNGTNQTVTALSYGNLTLSSSSGAVTKTMPGTAFTIEGNFSSSIGSGTSVSFTSASNITMNGSVTIGASTTFNGSSNSHIVRGNWINNGTFTGSTGTITFDGASTNISGAGTHNFNNINFSSTGITAAGININVSGNLSTTGSGQFTQNTGGSINMTGASKSITGTSIILNDLTVSGSVTASTSFTINGNLAVPGSFTGSTGILTMPGSAKTISGAGTIGFSTLAITGSVSTASSFSVSTLLNISGSFSASAGTATFTGTSFLTGTANLYNVTINGTSLQLSAASIMGIANTFSITAGTLNVSSTTPNTINFNGTGAQTVNAVTYHHLVLSNGNTKTAAGNTTVNGDLTISASTTFNGSSYTHSILKNWINNGTFTASSSTVQFTGAANATISGATTFSTLTENKSASTNTLSLLNNVSAATVTMTSGTMLTGNNALTITTTRSGNGIILGTITRTHSFTTLTAYAFEGPDNTITFTAVTGVTSVTLTVSAGSVSDFPNGASISREYIISVPVGTYTATLRLHYEDAELNGNTESSMTLWDYPSGSWSSSGKTGNSTTSNYVEQTGLVNIAYRWTCSGNSNGVVRWNGSVSTDWNAAANWTTVSGSPSTPPSTTDIVQIGTAAFTNQPNISNAVTVNSISFGSAQAATLTIASGGSLSTNGNISGFWTANASHTIEIGDQSLSVSGNLSLSNGTNNQSINLNIGTGTANVAGILTQSGDAVINFTGAGSLNIGNNFIYISGTFTAGSGTVNYTGTGSQTVAAVTYNNLNVNKSAGIASEATAISISGDLSVTSGTLNIDGSTVTINGNVTINSGTTLDCDGVTLNLAGNWTNNGNYIATGGSVIMNGTGSQSISAGNFNNLSINKSSGTATLAGNNTLTGDLAILSGVFDLSIYSANRSSSGGTLSISGGASLLAGGTNNFPSGFTTNTLSSTSLVHYNATGIQAVAGLTYGNISFSNGGSNAKTLGSNTVVAGDITINSGASFHSGGYSIALSGNWTNSGTFTPSTGTMVLNGSSKIITGNTIFNHVTVNGSYTVAGNDITYNGYFHVTPTGSYAAGSGTATVSSDLTNEATLTSTGTTNFTGTSVQTIRLVNALISTSTGIVNFNGNVSPLMNSTSSPQFATLNINNTAGINPSIGWTVFIAMNVNSGGKFNGGLSTHTIYGSFANSGTVTSTGIINFTPLSTKTVNFGSSGFTSDGTVKFAGSGQLTIAGTPGLLTHIIVSNTNGAGISPSSNWIIDSNFVITSTSIFHAGAYTFTIGGNVESDGTLDGGTSTFVMGSSAGELTASSATIFNNFTITGSVTPQTDFRVAGDFSNNGTYDGTLGVLIMTGANAATIGGSTTPLSIAQLTIEKIAAVVTQAVDMIDLSFLNIFSGVLFTSTKSITQDAGGGILIISDGATLRLGGTNSLPGFSGYGLDVNSNVDYAGTTQTVGNAANYGNLLITAAGNKNALVPFVVLGDMTISNGTLATSTITVTHSIAGDFIMTGGSLTGTTSTYKMDGDNDQALTLLSNLVNLTVNKSGGEVILGSNVTVNNVTNFTAGKINIGNYNYTIGSSGSITNYNSTKYFIATGSGTLVQQVSNGGSKIFPVGFGTSYLPATIALTAGSTTDNFNVRLLTAVYGQGTNGTVITSNAVNATWMIAEQAIGGSDATITLQWPASLEMPGFNRIVSRLAHHTSVFWDYGAADIAASGSDPYSVSRAGFTSFSPFAVGMLNTLPVTWLGLNGRNENNSNIINWSTSMEINNIYFAVEASIDGANFAEVGRVNGGMNSSSVQQYSFTHNDINGQVYYYRIRQVDIDGRSSFSKTIRIVPAGNLSGYFSLFPNPISDKKVNIIFNLKGEYSISLVDQHGRRVMYKTVSSSGAPILVNLPNMAPGLYILTVIKDKNIIGTEKIMVTN